MRFNQQTNDYTIDGLQAAPSQGKTALAEAAYLRLMTPKGAYFDDSSFGCELYKLKRSKDVPRIRRQAVRWVIEALEPLRTPHYLIDILVTAHDSIQAGYLMLHAVLISADGSQTPTTINVQVAG